MADIMFDIVPPTKTIDFIFPPVEIQYRERKQGTTVCRVRNEYNFLHQQPQDDQRE